MGSTTWDAGAYRKYSAKTSGQSAKQVFQASSAAPDLLPGNFKVRESRDSAANPASTPIIIGVDDTGSMGFLAAEIVTKGLGTVMEGIYGKKPVSNPHIMLAVVGDAYTDGSPLQATQFETDMALVDQTTRFYIEGGGGGNGGESYPLVWYMAAHKTDCDAHKIRNVKGYIFTVGDEAPHMVLRRQDIRNVFGMDVEADVKVSDLLKDVQEKWHVYHLITPTPTTSQQKAVKQWQTLLGERAVVVEDHTCLAEVIVSIMQVNAGHDLEEVTSAWGGDKSVVVANAVSGLAKGSKAKAELIPGAQVV